MSAVREPEQINREWSDAFNARDVAAMVELYEPEAVLIPGPEAAAATGHRAITAALDHFVGMGGKISYEPRYWIRSGDLALGSIRFLLRGGTDPEGRPVELSGATTEIARRQADGTWKYVIDHPFGSAG